MRFLACLYLLSALSSLSAQVVAERQVLGSGGDLSNSFASDLVEMSFTIGEALIQTQESQTLVLSQGFQQANVDTIQVGIESTPEHLLDIQLYPNPARKFITVDIQGLFQEPVTVVLFDLHGRLIPGFRYTFQQEGQQQFGLHNLASGVYLIQFRSGEGTPFQTIRLLKMN